ncbi:MAG: hypothetical protein GY765_26215, partial [bacterium]|nr:hypothetical protein [bacterium]
MCRKLFVTAILSLCVCVTFNLYGVEVKKKEINSFESFQEGNFNGTGLDNKGGIFIGPKIKALNGPTREYYLSLETDKSGNIYVGTGHKGSVFKISPRAAASEKQMLEVFKSDDLDVYALLVRNGHVFVGTSPDGKLYKVVDSKKPEVFFNPEEKFIWDIVEDAMGNIIIATGNTGSVYRIGKNAGGVKIFSSEDNHMVSLYVTRSGSILAGSGDRGILYQIDNTKVKVLFDSPFEEIRGICEDKDGNIFFSATHGIKKNASQTADTGESFMKRTEKRDKKPPKEKSILYCRRTNGVVEPVWFSKTEYIYSICYDENDNSVLVGTGNSGRVYRVTKEGNFGILYESDAAQVYKIRKATEGFYLLTNNSASIAFVENTLNSKGVYYSEIYDLDIQSRLGKIYWESETPPNTDVVLSVRAGNSNVPDSTWGQWSAPYTLPESSTMGLTDVRYFQVKAVLNASNLSVSPRLNSFKAFYIQSNLKPRVKKVIVRKALGKSGGTKKNPALQKNTNYLAVNWQVINKL